MITPDGGASGKPATGGFPGTGLSRGMRQARGKIRLYVPVVSPRESSGTPGVKRRGGAHEKFLQADCHCGCYRYRRFFPWDVEGSFRD